MPRQLPSPHPRLNLLFPVALLTFSTFFFAGRIGWWSDDYWHNQRHPVTGAITNLTINRGFFLRPLFYRLVPAITTLSWRAQWPAHLLEVLSHATVVVVLWRLLLSLGATRAAAGAAALLFMVYPAQFEALFWVSAIPTSLSCLLMLAMIGLTIAYARGRIRWWTLLLLPPLTFALCSLNEQPAAGILILPIAYWAALGSPRPLTSSPPHAFTSSPSAPRASHIHVLRSLLAPLLCGAAAILYIYLVSRPNPEKPPNARGSAETIVHLAGLWPRLQTFTDVLWRRLILKNFAEGALLTGADQLRARPLAALLFTGALVITATLWLRAWVSRPPDTPRPVARLFILGAALFTTGWLPILMIANYEPDSRTRYWPGIGAAMMLAALFSWLGARFPALSRPRVRLATGAALLFLLLSSALMLIGVQAAFRARFDKDRAEGEQLRALIPNPAPLTFFLPVHIDETAVHTRSPVFDGHFRSAWEFPWTAPKFIESAYRRTDVRCGYYRHWTPGVPLKGADESGIHYAERLGPAFPPIEGSGSRVPWDRALPFIVGPDGVVRIVTDVVVAPGPDGRPFEVHIHQAPPDAAPLRIRLPRN
jgi:hypothetical protein